MSKLSELILDMLQRQKDIENMTYMQDYDTLLKRFEDAKSKVDDYFNDTQQEDLAASVYDPDAAATISPQLLTMFSSCNCCHCRRC